ncbi:hypothetical protein, partial [Streptococcus sp. 1453]|uniref:hypothetical protein n=1 Tax=Streptococcus sp. 1453 TaxID=2582661 RepID=UPI0015911BE4
VEQAKQNGLTAIDSVDNPTPATHTAAYEKLDQKANEKKATINGIQHLTKEENAVKAAIESKEYDATPQIDQAKSKIVLILPRIARLPRLIV